MFCRQRVLCRTNNPDWSHRSTEVQSPKPKKVSHTKSYPASLKHTSLIPEYRGKLNNDEFQFSLWKSCNSKLPRLQHCNTLIKKKPVCLIMAFQDFFFAGGSINFSASENFAECNWSQLNCLSAFIKQNSEMKIIYGNGMPELLAVKLIFFSSSCKFGKWNVIVHLLRSSQRGSRSLCGEETFKHYVARQRYRSVVLCISDR